MKYHQKGSIVVFALIVLSFILIAAFSVAAVTLVERRSANISVNSTTAFQQADKGMEEFLQQLYKDLEQTDTLNTLTAKLNEIYGSGMYTCQDPSAAASASIPSYIGDEDTEFIISAYMEKPVEAHNAGWNNDALIPIRDCGTELADVARFKVAGNYSTAVRAIFVKLRDSLTRGLVAHWSFEDRAINSRLTENEEAHIAQDLSKNDHILTLCHPEDLPIKVELTDGTDMGDVVTFTDCAENSSDFIVPEKDEAWVEGFVLETVDPGPLGDDAQEAIYFDGNDYLAMYAKDSCAADDYNCVENDTENKISDLTNGITISLWIKPDSTTSTGTLISQYSSNNGFKIYLDAGKPCFMLQNKKACADDAISDEWHHVVGRWREGEVVKIIVDDKEKEGESLNASITVPDETLFVGSQDDTTGFYTGAIDDLRMWDRSLTDAEVNRLCTIAQGSPEDPDDLDPKCFK